MWKSIASREEKSSFYAEETAFLWRFAFTRGVEEEEKEEEDDQRQMRDEKKEGAFNEGEKLMTLSFETVF